MVVHMPSSINRQRILLSSLFISLLLLLSSPSFALTTAHSFQLLDKPEGSRTYSLTISVTDALYQYYLSQDHNLYNYDFSKFVTPETFKPIADDLWQIYDNYEDFANGVLMLVHQIPYIESIPQKYPIETLVENEGDCDLFSILTASIMIAGGLDVVLLLLEEQEHMMVGIHLPTKPTDSRSSVCYYTHEGKEYYVAETTGGNWTTGWRVGECSETLQRATATIIPLTNCEWTTPGQVASSYNIPDSSSISISLSTSFTISNNNVEILGSINPPLSGENITLYITSMGSPVTMLATVSTDSNGYYYHTWQNPSGGIYLIQSNWSGDENYSGADSNTYRLVVFPSELLMGGILLITFLVVLIIVSLATRGKTKEYHEDFEDWDLMSNPEDF